CRSALDTSERHSRAHTPSRSADTCRVGASPCGAARGSSPAALTPAVWVRPRASARSARAHSASRVRCGDLAKQTRASHHLGNGARTEFPSRGEKGVTEAEGQALYGFAWRILTSTCLPTGVV